MDLSALQTLETENLEVIVQSKFGFGNAVSRCK
jgi:hypothetical protein